tara:strand:- start:5143 stop:5295 length:153 start_codon:yes stop_codon:yes gene_type:complete
MKITGWKLVITWEDDSTEDVVDIPDWVAKVIDGHLDELEAETEHEEVNNE